jgi:hypothetical protein
MSGYVPQVLRVPLSTTLIQITFTVMDIFKELEMMMLNALEGPGDDDRYEPSEENIARGQHRFNYSRVEALSLIEERRRDFTRIRVSNEYREIVQSYVEAQDYDSEAYEHTLEIGGEINHIIFQRESCEAFTSADTCHLYFQA